MTASPNVQEVPADAPGASSVTTLEMHGASEQGRWVVARGGDWQWGPFLTASETASFLLTLSSTPGPKKPYAVNLAEHPRWFEAR